LLASCLSAAIALPQEQVDLAAGSGQSQAAAHAADDRLARARLIARGEDLFFNETFNGNGRTCGTCHPVENNFTLDPGFIGPRSSGSSTHWRISTAPFACSVPP